MNNDDELPPLRPLTRCITIPGPCTLIRDADLYVLCDGPTKIIKSWITDKPVPNRRLNERGHIEMIDPTIEEEDRRLLIPNAILAENLSQKWITNK